MVRLYYKNTTDDSNQEELTVTDVEDWAEKFEVESFDEFAREMIPTGR